MAKTVFGVPGVGKKPEGGGGAVAPGGTPGAKSSGGLPQKSGMQSLSKEKLAPKTAPVSSPKPVAAKPKTPQMAKPMAVPVAKPVAGAAPKGGAPAEGKTVFGMPAMKLPSTPPPEPAEQPPAPAPEVPQEQAPADADAYNATVLGMAAVEPNATATEGPPSEQLGEQLPEEVRPTTGAGISAGEPEVAPPADSFARSTPDVAQTLPQEIPEQPREVSGRPPFNIPMWVPAAVLGFFALVIIVMAIFVF